MLITVMSSQEIIMTFFIEQLFHQRKTTAFSIPCRLRSLYSGNIYI